LDAICANDIGKMGVGFAADDNEILWMRASAKPVQVRGSKAQIAAFILNQLAQWGEANE
jgi:hypothetical protein